jgi:RNA polymerase sigma factor (sigma-70 family)
VHGTALRQLRRADWAAEAAQDAFVLLARKAPRLSGAALGAWLHRTALFTAAALLKKEARHARRVSRWADEQEPGDPAPPEHMPELDPVLNALPDKDRSLLLLRYFENRTAAQAAEHLGLTPEAAQKRTERALKRLSSLLHRRGATIALPALAAGLASQLGQAAPAGFSRAVLTNSVAAPAGTGLTLLHSLAVMKASQAALLTLLLTIVPTGVLLFQNNRLRESLAAESKKGSSVSASNLLNQTGNKKAAAVSPPASTTGAKEINWDQLGENDKITVELSRDTILNSDLKPLANYTLFTLSDGVRELLRISDAEAKRVETALRTCEEAQKKIERSRIKRIEDLPNGVVFEVPAFAAEGKPLRDQLFAEVIDAVGQRRAEFLLPKIAAATDWRLGRFGEMKRRYRVEFQQDQPVIEADGTKRSTELLVTRIDFERGDSLSHSEIMEHDGPILQSIATKTKGTHVIYGEIGGKDSVMISPEVAHLFTVEELRK